MKLLAPIVLILALSGALYKTKEVWPKADYEAAKDAKEVERQTKPKPAAAST